MLNTLTKGAVCLMLACAALASCGTAEERGVGDRDGEGRTMAARQALPTDGQVCVTIQRGTSGAVEDAIVWQSTPTWNDGARMTLGTGTSASGGLRRSLLKFDLGSIPAGATVNSATLSVYQLYKNVAGTIAGHAATAAWTESTVKWSTFGDSFEPAAFGGFDAPGGGSSGWRTLDVQALAQAWVSGARANHGVVLIETGASYTDYRSSESTTTAQRPKLELCYATCTDGVQNGAETGVDCGGPSCPSCCVPQPEVCDGLDNDCDGAVDDGLCQTAPDACHLAGACDPQAGQCSYPNAPDGTACNDGNACTQTDTCQAGACLGGDPRSCASTDGCREPGTCDPATGACSPGAPVPDGQACDDGNACTQDEVCQAGACVGGTQVACAPIDACHDVGECDPATGGCGAGPALANGTACDDGNPNTEYDTCQTGTCQGASSVVITIQSPAYGAASPTDTVQVSGTVDQPVSAVRVAGVPAAVSGSSFSATVTLHEGSNIIAVEAVGANGNPGAASTLVLRDTTPPRVTITQPPDRALIGGATTTVLGTVQDLLIGTVNTEDCTVTVNGVDAVVENRSFRAENVPVAEGEGTITVVATDPGGNTKAAVINVTGTTAPNAMIFTAGGDGQTGVIGTTLAQPVTAFVADNTGAPVAGVPVTFQVSRSDGSLSNGERVETVISDAQGMASVPWTLGTSTGSGSDQVIATAPAFLGQAVFSAGAVVDPTSERVLVAASGGFQRTAQGALAPLPLAVLVSDRHGNPMGYQEVTFSVRRGSGRVDGASSVTKVTDFDGRAFVLLTAGQEVGEASQIVEAMADGGNAVQFVASTLAAGAPADTGVSGLVMTNENLPIANVLVRVEGTSLQSVTDTEGRFAITGAPPGRIHLFVDGTTGGPYPELELEVDLVSGADNAMERPVYLPAIDVDGVVVVNEATDVTIRRADMPGLLLTIPAGSATFQRGACATSADCEAGFSCVAAVCQSKSGTVQVITVHSDKVPMLPSDGATPMTDFAIMPHSVRFDPPAPIRFPNVEGHPPGAVVSMYSYDHDLGTFVVVGSATVSEDGLEVVSEPGQGIVKGGWHYVPPPPPPPPVLPSVQTSCVILNPANQNGYCGLKVCTGTSAANAACQTCRLGSNGLPVAGTCTSVAATGPWSPDAGCYVSKVLNCGSPSCTPPNARPVGSACTRGYDPSFPGLSGLPGQCIQPPGSSLLSCCPFDPNPALSHICPSCQNPGQGAVCCAAACGADGCCN